MTRAVLAVIFLVMLSQPQVFAKRSAPQEVADIVADNIKYQFPMTVERQGYVDAYAAKTNHLIWSRQIYVVLKDPNLEGDVQDVYITEAKIAGPTLLITNEKGYVYSLDLSTLEVKALKGSVAVRRH